MPMMVGMMVCAVVVVCAAEAHLYSSISREISYTRPSRRVSNDYQTGQCLNLECDDLSTLWSLRHVAASSRSGVFDETRQRAATGQSGDRSPHSKLRQCPARLFQLRGASCRLQLSRSE